MGRVRRVLLALLVMGYGAAHAEGTNSLVVRDQPNKSRRSLHEVALSDLQAVRVLSTNNLPLKVLVACTQQTRTQAQGFLEIVKGINASEHLDKADRIRVHLVTDGTNTRPSFQLNDGLPTTVQVPSTLRELPLAQEDFDTICEVSRARAFGMPDAWLQDWGKVLMARVPSEKDEQLVVLDVNRVPASDEGLPGILAKQWSGLYTRLSPAGTQAPAGDYGGNMEVTPDDVLLLGSTASPALRALFAHGYADRTAILDVSWLSVGHVDEIVAIVPNARQARGYTILKADPRLGLALHPVPTSEENLEAARIIDASVAGLIRTIQTASGDPSDVSVVSLPVLYQKSEGKSVAQFPNVVNLVSLRNHAVVPDPTLPAFRERTRTALEGIGITPHFLADTPYHERGGELHCGTYVFRHPNRYLLKNRLAQRRRLFEREEKK